MGHPRGWMSSGRCISQSRRRREQPGGRLCLDQIHRVAEKICPARSPRHDVLGSRSGSGSGPRRSADLLVQRLYGGVEPAGSSSRQRRRNAEVAHGPVAPWPVLEGRHAERLSGLRFMDHAEIHSARAAQGSLALCPICRLQVDLAEEAYRGPHADPPIGSDEPDNG